MLAGTATRPGKLHKPTARKRTRLTLGLAAPERLRKEAYGLRRSEDWRRSWSYWINGTGYQRIGARHGRSGSWHRKDRCHWQCNGQGSGHSGLGPRACIGRSCGLAKQESRGRRRGCPERTGALGDNCRAFRERRSREGARAGRRNVGSRRRSRLANDTRSRRKRADARHRPARHLRPEG